MRDIGLTEAYIGGEQRFEVEGADRARDFVLDNGMSEEKADILWNVIALNTRFGIASRKRPEIALAHFGAGLDTRGSRYNEIDSQTIQRIVDEYPRLESNVSLTSLFACCIRRKPGRGPGNIFGPGCPQPRRGNPPSNLG